MIKTILDNNRFIWQIHLSGSDIIVIEERLDKQAFFHVYDTLNDKIILKDLQFDEKSWIGIEQVYYDKIIFHWYQTPEMPYHKGIMVYDIYKQKIILKNEFETFLFINDGKLFTSFAKMLGDEIKSYDLEKGNIVENFGINNNEIEKIRYQVNKDYLYKNYYYPLYYDEIENIEMKELVQRLSVNYKSIISESEVIETNEYFIVGLQIKKEGIFVNKVIIFEKKTNKVIKELDVNKGEKIIKSCFFVLNYSLFIIIEKKRFVKINL